MSGSPEGPFWTSDTPNTKDPEVGWIPRIEADIRECLQKGIRPVVLATIKNPKGKVLLLQPTGSEGQWTLPQKEADGPDTPVRDVLASAVEESTGILKGQTGEEEYLDAQWLELGVDSDNEQGASGGTRHFAFSVPYKEPSRSLKLPPEFDRFAWVHPSEADRYLDGNDPAGAVMLEAIRNY